MLLFISSTEVIVTFHSLVKAKTEGHNQFLLEVVLFQNVYTPPPPAGFAMVLCVSLSNPCAQARMRF